MSQLVKLMFPRVRRSIKTRGWLRTVGYCFLGPYYLWRSYANLRRNYGRKDAPLDPFDVEYGTETSQRVPLSQLDIQSPNWVIGTGYWPTPTTLAREVLANLRVYVMRISSWSTLAQEKGGC